MKKPYPLFKVVDGKKVKEVKTSSGRYFSSDELLLKAKVSYKGTTSNKEKLECTLEMLENIIPIAEGLCRARPSQSSFYSLTNLIREKDLVLNQLEESLDIESFSEVIYTNIIVPFLDGIIKDLGKNIKRTKGNMSVRLGSKKQKKVDKQFEDMFRRFGKNCESSLIDTKKSLLKIIKTNI